MGDPDYYALLGIADDAGPDMVHTAWRENIARHHPDRGGDPVMAMRLNEAYRVLIDPVARADYDAQRSASQGLPSVAGPLRPTRSAERVYPEPPSIWWLAVLAVALMLVFVAGIVVNYGFDELIG